MVFFLSAYLQPTMILMISRLVSFMPCLPRRAYVPQGVFDPLGHDAVAAAELLAPDVHIVAEQSGFHRRGDLSGAGRLGTIADDAGHHGQRIDDGVDDGFVPAAAEVSDTCTGPGPALMAPQ